MVNSADQIDQLASLRFKLQWGVRTYQGRNSRTFQKNGTPGIGTGTPNGACKKYGDSDREVEIVAIAKNGTFLRIPYADIHEGDP